MYASLSLPSGLLWLLPPFFPNSKWNKGIKGEREKEEDEEEEGGKEEEEGEEEDEDKPSLSLSFVACRSREKKNIFTQCE